MAYVSNVATSALGTGAQVGYGNRRIDRCPSNGVMWTVVPQDTTALGLRFYYSSDGGVTWNLASGMDVANAGNLDCFSIFIDADDYLWLLWQNKSTNLPQLRRGTPNAGRTSYTWGTDLAMGAGVDATGAAYQNLVVHREGTGWVAHCAFSYLDGVSDRFFWRRCIIAADGTIGAYTSVTVISDLNGTGEIKPMIDFNHTGDGKTVAGGVPHIYLGWLFTRTGTTYGLGFKKAAYSTGPTWTVGSNVTFDSAILRTNETTTGDWCRGFFDGTRWVCLGVSTIATVPTYFHFERDAADTTSTQQQKFTAGVNTFWGDGMYDTATDIYVLSQTKAEASGSRIFSYKKWLRASNTFSASTTIDATTQTHVVSLREGWLGAKMDYIYEDAAAAPQTVKYGRITVNSFPDSPALVYPVSNQSIARDVSQLFDWTFSDPDAGNTQTKYDFQYRVVGAGSWTQTLGVVSTTSARTVAANTFVDSTQYEWQVRTYDNADLAGPWSSSGFFWSYNTPATPVMVAPSAGGVVNANPYLVDWSFGASQDKYQVQVWNGGSQVYESGEIASAVTDHSTPFPDNNTTRIVKIRVQDNGLWSAFASNTITVTYAPPADPTAVTAQWVDLATIGTNHAITVTATYGGTPVPTVHDVYFRPVGTTGNGTRVAAGVAPGSTTTWHEPQMVPQEVRFFKQNATGENAFSAWFPVTGVGSVVGFLVHDPVNPTGTITHVRMNDRGASEEYAVESALIALQGREFPVVEYGDGSSRKVTVPSIFSEAGEADKLKAIMNRRTVLCYRDHAGRKVFGSASGHEESDVYWGKRTKFEIEQVDWTEGV